MAPRRFDDVEDVDDAAEHEVGDEPRRLRRRRGLAWAAGALAVVLAGMGVAYYIATENAADRLLLRWRASPPDCGNAKVRPATDDSFGSLTPAAVVVTEDFRCTVVVEVLNTSDRAVHLEHAVAQGVGAETGLVVRADLRAHPQRPHVDDLGPERSGIDAYVEIGGPEALTLEAGQSAAFAVHLQFNPDGCVMGATTWQDGWPEVHFSVLGREFVRPAANSLAFFHRGRTPGCRTMNG